MNLNSVLSDLYTMRLTWLTDRSNSSASGSKQIPSINLRFNIFLSRSLCMYSFIN